MRKGVGEEEVAPSNQKLLKLGKTPPDCSALFFLISIQCFDFELIELNCCNFATSCQASTSAFPHCRSLLL